MKNRPTPQQHFRALVDQFWKRDWYDSKDERNWRYCLLSRDIYDDEAIGGFVIGFFDKLTNDPEMSYAWKRLARIPDREAVRFLAWTITVLRDEIVKLRARQDYMEKIERYTKARDAARTLLQLIKASPEAPKEIGFCQTDEWKAMAARLAAKTGEPVPCPMPITDHETAWLKSLAHWFDARALGERDNLDDLDDDRGASRKRNERYKVQIQRGMVESARVTLGGPEYELVASIFRTIFEEPATAGAVAANCSRTFRPKI